MNRGASIGSILLLSGTATIVIGLVLVAVLGAWWPWIVVGVGASDLVIALAVRRGSEDDQTTVESGENPYARED